MRSAGLIVLLVLIGLLAGCGTERSALPVDLDETRLVTDDLGRSVRVPIRIERAISLAPNLTENIFAVGAGDRLVGVTTYCDYPEQTASIAKVGDTMNPNLETIVGLQPDIVFVSTASQIEAFTGTLAVNGIAVFVMNPTSFDAVLNNLEQLGWLFGTAATAEELTATLRYRVDTVKAKVGGVRPVRVFVQFSREPLFTAGKQSFINSILEMGGGRSVTADVETAFPMLSKETARALNTEAIILSQSDDNREPNDVFQSSEAVRNGRVYAINADILSRPGPRLVDAVEQIARVLHNSGRPTPNSDGDGRK